MIIDLVNNGAKNFKVSIKEYFTNDMEDVCPIVSYKIVKAIEKISGNSSVSVYCSKMFSNN